MFFRKLDSSPEFTLAIENTPYTLYTSPPRYGNSLVLSKCHNGLSVLPELFNPGLLFLLHKLNCPTPVFLPCGPSRGLNRPPALPACQLPLKHACPPFHFPPANNEISLIMGGDMEAACRTDCLIVWGRLQL